MLMNNKSWFIAITFFTKSCVLSSEIRSFNFHSLLPNLNSSLITKPIHSLYQAPLSAVSLLRQANPLNYLTDPTSASGFENSNDHENNRLNQKHKSDAFGWNSPLKTSSPYVTQKQHTPTSISYATSEMIPKYNSVKLPENVYKFPTAITLPNGSSDYETFQLQNNIDHVTRILEQLDRKFYQASFRKLLSISPTLRRENGISFAQSGLFLYLELLALCTESDEEIVKEIKQSLGIATTCAEHVQLLTEVLSTLPKSSDFLKFKWSSRLVIGPRLRISENFLEHIAPNLHVYVNQLNKTDGPGEVTKRLNQMVESDSGGAMQDTFEEEELPNGVCAAWLTTIYLRARWRSAPTALNGSWLFQDGDAPPRTVRMIRINDIMRYVHLDEWDAEAIEIRYAAPDLTLLIFIPRSRSLKKLSEYVSANNLQYVYDRMQTKRVAVILPIYTLRMTLLLPGKLEMMGISRLVNTTAGAECESLKLSHSVQRIMFWAEAGRNAFKDDGIEWDEAPQLERVMDRPYIFFVRWLNITILSGNFVL